MLATQAAEPDTGDGKGVPVKMTGGREHERMIRDECNKRKHFEVRPDQGQPSDPGHRFIAITIGL
jgi:hypothetical protein